MATIMQAVGDQADPQPGRDDPVPPPGAEVRASEGPLPCRFSVDEETAEIRRERFFQVVQSATVDSTLCRAGNRVHLRPLGNPGVADHCRRDERPGGRHPEKQRNDDEGTPGVVGAAYGKNPARNDASK